MSPRKRIWPGTEAERQDRRRVIELVEMTGEEKLQFTVYDVRRTMEKNPRLMLNHSGQLSRHIHVILDGFVVRVDQRLDYGRAQDEDKPTKARHQFVLAHRIDEWKAAPPVLDDLERVYHAVWVAVEAAGVREVPTKAVTRVLKNVEDLALRTPRNTRNHLVTLNDRNRRLLEESKPNGPRWSHWEPVGPKPEHPHFDRWVRTMQALDEDDFQPARFGHATLGSMMVELIGIAVRESISSTYPAGRPVSISVLRALAGSNGRAAAIRRAFAERGASFGSILGDLTKERVAGRTRVHQQVVKVASPIGEGTYYDRPDIDGYEARRLVLPYQEVRNALSEWRLLGLQNEVRKASRLLASHHSDILQTIGLARQHLVHQELDSIGERLEDLQLEEHLLSETVRDSLMELKKRLGHVLAGLPGRYEVEGGLKERLKALGLTVDALDVDPGARPLLTPNEYVDFLGERMLEDDQTPAEFLAHVKKLERYSNPAFTEQTDEDPIKAARYGVDRVDALLYMSERYRGRTLFFLRQGGDLLGSTLRDPTLPRLVLTQGFERERRAGLAALVLLDADDAGDQAREALGDAGRPREIVDALHALLVLRQIDPGDLPGEVIRSRQRRTRDAVREVVLASRTGRWLLQG